MKRCVSLMRPGRLIPRTAPFPSPHAVTGGRHYKRLIACDPLSESDRIKKSEQDSLARLHQLSGLGDAKLLKSLGRSFKGRHLYGALEVKDCFLRLLLSCLVLDGGRQVGSIVIDPTL